MRLQIRYYGPQRLRLALLLCTMLAAAVVGGTFVTRQARIGRAAGGTAWATDAGWKQALSHGNPEVLVALRGDTQVEHGTLVRWGTRYGALPRAARALTAPILGRPTSP